MSLCEMDLEVWPCFFLGGFPDPFANIGTKKTVVVHDDVAHVDDLRGGVWSHAEHGEFLEILDRIKHRVDWHSCIILERFDCIFLGNQLCWSYFTVYTKQVKEDVKAVLWDLSRDPVA